MMVTSMNEIHLLLFLALMRSLSLLGERHLLKTQSPYFPDGFATHSAALCVDMPICLTRDVENDSVSVRITSD